MCIICNTNLSENKIINLEICEKVQTLPDFINPVSLNFCGNKLVKKIPEYKNLKYLFIDNTNIETLPLNLEKIQQISANGSKIKEVPFYENLEKLKHDEKQALERLETINRKLELVTELLSDEKKKLSSEVKKLSSEINRLSEIKA